MTSRRPSLPNGIARGALLPAIAAATIAIAPAGGGPAAPLAPGPGPSASEVLRYDLRPGDHLVYRQTLEEETVLGGPHGLPGGPPVPFARSRRTLARASWRSHVVVVDSGPGGAAVGFQRNRESVDVERFEVGGGELGAEGAEGWLGYVAPSAHARFADANGVTPEGNLIGPPAVAREWGSKALWAVSELPPLPADEVEPGDAWRTPGGLPFLWRAVGWAEAEGERCLDVEGAFQNTRLLFRQTLPDTVRMRYRVCPGSGLVRRVEFEGSWPGPIFQRIRQTVTIELTGRTRGEDPSGWIADPEVRDAALQAWTLAVAPPEPAALESAWSAEDPGTRKRALALALRFEEVAPDGETLDRLAADSDARVRAAAVRLAARRGEAGILERARDDPDYFVRGVALAATEPATDAVACAENPGAWLRRAARKRVATPHPPGSRLHRLRAPGLEGVPWAVHVPYDYTGEEPFPLLVYLSGNAGPFMEGVLIARSAAERAGYLVAYPDAGGFWWTPGGAATAEAVLDAVLREFAVDPDRIYLSGLSNGGTGAYYVGTLLPHRWTAVVSAMGGGHYAPFLSRDDVPIPSNAAHVPFLFLHGEQDQTISPDASRRTAELMRPHRATLETWFFPDRGHGISISRGDDGRTIEFLQRHERRAPPGSLSFALQTLRWPRHYWLEVLEKDPGIARVQATVQPDGTIRLVSENVRRLRLLVHPDLLEDPGSLRVVASDEEVFSGGVRIDCETLERSWRETGDPYLAWGAVVEVELPTAPEQ